MQLANRLFECIYQPLFSTRFLIWVVLSKVIIQIEIRQKIRFPGVPLYQCSLYTYFQDLITLYRHD